MTAPPQFLIVGMGGSAGSIASFREFFRHVPADSGMAYVVILHLAPDQESRLAEVLQVAAKIPVTQVHDATRVQPDHVYVIPPNKSLAMNDGTLVLSTVTSFEERRAPIDIFFRTLAETHDSRAVCVVLSGSGSDGSMGLRRVKEYNGLVLVQDPAEAAFAEMPRNCIGTGLVDYVVRVSEMPGRILEHRDHLGEIHIPEDVETRADGDEQALMELFTLLRVRTGHDFTNYKRATVLRRIERRMAVRDILRLADYADLVREHNEEAHALLRELLISVTNFFRDPDVWENVDREVIPKLLAHKRSDDHLRVWVPGCATGEEAYTIAMLLAEHDAPNVQIFATDLDERAIARARNGWYSEAEVADVPPERLRRFFLRDQDGYRVRRELRETVLFAHHNLIKDPPFSHLDFVSCRNLLIYLNRAAQQRAMELLHFSLEPGGYLLLGTAESIDGSPSLFSVEDKEAHLYRARAVERVVTVRAPLPHAEAHTEFAPVFDSIRLPDPRARERFAPLELHHRMLEQYAPPSLVVDERYEIVHLTERVGRYLQFSGGEVSTNLLQVVRQELRADVRSALFQAGQKRATVAARGLELHVAGDRTEKIDVIVRPVLSEDDPARGFFLVLFERSQGREEPLREATALEPAARQLEDELLRVKAQMRATVEQYEVQAEESKAANEELQAMNEELRSTTEELETSQEELQSVNEELETVNQELKVKIEEISQAGDDLRNLISSTDVGTIFVDRSLRVKLFTPRARDLFNLIAGDVGRPLLDITHKLAVDDLEENMARVLDRLHTIEREVATRDGAWYLLRLLPYRTSEERIDGVVLTFLDITVNHRAAAALRESEARFRALAQASSYVLYRMSPDWSRICQLSASGVLGDAVSGSQWLSEFIGPEDRARVQAAIGRAIREKAPLEVEHHAIGIDGAGWSSTRAVPIIGPNGEIVEWFGAATDITFRMRAEEALRDAEARYRALFVSMDQGYAVVEMVADEHGAWSDFRFVEVNPAFEKHTGMHDVAGRTATELLGTPNPHWAQIYGQVAATGRPMRFEESEPVLGRLFDLYAFRLGGVESRRVAVLVTDVTRRKQDETALRDTAARLQTITNLVADLLWSNDPSGQTDWFNERWIEYTGQMLDEASGEGWLEAIHPEDREAFRERFRHAVGSGEPLRDEPRIRGAAGEYRLFLVTAAPLRDAEGRALRWFGRATDIHEERMAREGLEERVRERTHELLELSVHRQQLLERLVSVTEEERQRIARELHDQMGQHLTALRMRIESLQVEEDRTDELKKIIARIDQSIDRLTLELRPPALDQLGLHGAITSLADEFSAASGIRVALHVGIANDVRFARDVESALYRVLQESLTNVWKHAAAETVSVILERERDALRMIIEDDGCGFDADGTAGGAPARGRFGLLGIRERLALVGGTLHIESEPNSGATIYVRVPLREQGTEA